MENLKAVVNSFTELSNESWEILSGCISAHTYKKGEILLKEGEVCQAIYFIATGYCQSSFNQDGKTVNTAFFFENDFATNIKSLINGTSSDYEIRACESVQVFKLDRLSLLSAYKKSGEIESFGRRLLEMMVSRQEAELHDLKLLTPQQRYEKLILTQPELLQRVSLTRLSSYLGVSRETLSRIRGK